MQLVVGAVIYNSDTDRFLCGKRYKYNKWEFIGGKVEEDETPEEALRREVIEEIGCEVKVGDMVKDVQHDNIRLLTYMCDIELGKPVLYEHEALAWIKRDELWMYDFLEADIPTVRELMEWV
ncbi:(deoxy)nucleoside triphosphate pyrophosphohydrolase [Paenibacillus cremeus]|nr:(deoxy)nucleoside triphosphate pyrophosphohydrolase [Paenibacillus cremeus]